MPYDGSVERRKAADDLNSSTKGIVMKKTPENRIDLEKDIDEDSDTRSTLVRLPRGADSKIFHGWGVKL